MQTHIMIHYRDMGVRAGTLQTAPLGTPPNGLTITRFDHHQVRFVHKQ
jgi:hypothetical protein